MLRKILSPRETKSKRSHSVNAAHNGDSYKGQPNEDSGEDVKNINYGDPDLYPPTRSQSLIVGDMASNPPLPPRNLRGPREDSMVYVNPADTLKKASSPLPATSPTLVPSPSGTGGATGGDPPPGSSPHQHQPRNSDYTTPVLKSEGATRSELRQMQMHQLTQSQRKQGMTASVGAGGGGEAAMTGGPSRPSNGHNRTRSFGNVTDNSDYSVPFNLLQQNAASSSSATSGSRMPSGMKPQQQLTKVQSNERIIPINPSTSPQPPYDRSDTNSPCSPLSNQSSEQETVTAVHHQEDDYAIPWDRSKVVNMIQKKSAGGDRRRDLQQQTRSGSLRDSSPPAPGRAMHRFHSAREQHQCVVENSPPPPDLTFAPTSRSHGVRVGGSAGFDRGHQDNIGGSTSPVHRMHGAGHSYGKSSHEMPDDVSQHALHSGRRLPTPPRLDPPRDRVIPPPPPRGEHEAVVIDVDIPLDDQP